MPELNLNDLKCVLFPYCLEDMPELNLNDLKCVLFPVLFRRYV